MLFIKCAGKETPLPQMSYRIFLHVHMLRISHVKGIERFCKRIMSHWYSDKVHMIVHETVSPNFQRIFFSIEY